MSTGERLARLKRVAKTLNMLREAELARQATANARRAAASSAASELDAIDLETSLVWSLFPQNWLTFRSRLDQEITEHAVQAELAVAEAMRIEKASDRFAGMVVKLETHRDEKQAAQEILDFISGTAASGKSALGKIAKVDLSPRKR